MALVVDEILLDIRCFLDDLEGEIARRDDKIKSLEAEVESLEAEVESLNAEADELRYAE